MLIKQVFIYLFLLVFVCIQSWGESRGINQTGVGRGTEDPTWTCLLLCLSLWYKMYERHEKSPDGEPGGGWVGRHGTGGGEGCGAQGLAQRVDTESVPDLQPLQPKGKEWRDSKTGATGASWSFGSSVSVHLWSLNCGSFEFYTTSQEKSQM